MHKHIFLIGMPGAGKTTVGKMLAKELGRDFYELGPKRFKIKWENGTKYLYL